MKCARLLKTSGYYSTLARPDSSAAKQTRPLLNEISLFTAVVDDDSGASRLLGLVELAICGLKQLLW